MRLYWSLFLAFSCTCIAYIAHAQQAPRPNIILIVADDLGWGDVSYHGSGGLPTPHIDALASGGVRMEQFYAQPTCTPSRGSLMTGLLPFRLGMQERNLDPWDHGGLPLPLTLLPEALRMQGYATAMVGKWHLGHTPEEYLPHKRGFDYHYGIYGGGANYFNQKNAMGHDLFQNGNRQCTPNYITGSYEESAVGLIQQYAAQAQPFFLYLPFTAPHTPLDAPEAYKARFAHIQDPKRRTYMAMTAALDDAIGHIKQEVERQGIAEQTLIIFLSDNGGRTDEGAINWPLKGGKGTLQEGGIRVPALAYWPGQLPAGQAVFAPMHISDLYPTLLRLGGAPLPPYPIDGKDVWTSISERSPSPHSLLILNLSDVHTGALSKGWKLISFNWKTLREAYQQGAGWEAYASLYYLPNDIEEQNNLIATFPEQATALIDTLLALESSATIPLPALERPSGIEIPKFDCSETLGQPLSAGNFQLSAHHISFETTATRYYDSMHVTLMHQGLVYLDTAVANPNIFEIRQQTVLPFEMPLSFYARPYPILTLRTNAETLTRALPLIDEARLEEANGFLFPNPFHDRLLLALHLDKSTTLRAAVFNAQGLLMETLHLRTNADGLGTFGFNTAQWTPGIYYVRLTDETGQTYRSMRAVKR